jgi:hypothetical protein
MKTRIKKAKGFIVNALVQGVQSTCSATHLGLSYSIKGVEIVESKLVHRVYGLEEEEVIKERRLHTNVTMLNNAKAYNAFKERVVELAKSKFGSPEEVIVETIDHGNMFV